MNRRNFINKGFMSLAACYGLSDAGLFANSKGEDVLSAPKKKHRIGIQLISVGEELKKDFAGTLKKVSEIGYSTAEAWGFDGKYFFKKSLKELNTMLNDVGMKLSGTHCGTGFLPEDVNAPEWSFWHKCCEEMNAAGGGRLIQAWSPKITTSDELKRLTEQYNKAGEICKKNGLLFGFHNHLIEFEKIDGTMILEYMIQNTQTDLVFFQMDLGHVLNGGSDIAYYFDKYAKRFTAWHASDFIKGKDYTLLGQGDVNYPELFKTAGKYLEDLTVEYSGDDRLAIGKANFDYLAKFPWTKAKKK